MELLFINNKRSECEGISVSARVYINETDPCEIWGLKIKNNNNKFSAVSIYSFADFDLTGYQRYSGYNSYVHSEYDKENNIIMCFNNAMEGPHEWFNGFAASNIAPQSFETSRNGFLGTYGSIAAPQSIKNEKLSNNLFACGQMCAAMQQII